MQPKKGEEPNCCIITSNDSWMGRSELVDRTLEKAIIRGRVTYACAKAKCDDTKFHKSCRSTSKKKCGDFLIAVESGLRACKNEELDREDGGEAAEHGQK